MTDRRAYGNKSKGGSSSSESPNTLASSSTARIVEILSHGECVGLADHDNPLKSTFFDNTPAQNGDDTFNYNGLTLQVHTGLPNDEPFTGFSDVENQVDVGLILHHGSPYVYTVTNHFVDAVRVAIQVDALSEQDSSSGDINGTSVSYSFATRIGSGAWTTVINEYLNDKCTSPQQISYRIERPAGASDTDQWGVQVTRVTVDAPTVNIQNQIEVASVAEITDSNLQYADLCAVAITVDSLSFGSSIPTRSYDLIGMVLDVPSNYVAPDPLNALNTGARSYPGFWDGTFKRAWTDNPAWILWALMTDKEWGLGKELDPSQIDKWTLYQIAQYCDEWVDDGTGTGGLEPRYRINVQITNADTAYAVLQSIASVFRGMLYWGTGVVSFIADRPQDPIKLVSPANVIDGTFTYQGAALKARHSVVRVTWNDPTNFFKATTLVVEDADMLQRFGWRPTDLQAYGCTSAGQARRMGRWVLDTEKYESETVTYSASLDHADMRPGQIIQIYDPFYAGARLAGRIVAITSTGAQVDAPVDIDAGKTYTAYLTFADGTMVSRQLTNSAATGVVNLTWSNALGQLPDVGSVGSLFCTTELASTSRAFVKDSTTTSVTFNSGVVLDTQTQYNIIFTLADGSTQVRAITTDPTVSGTQYGNSSEWTVLEVGWATPLTTQPYDGSIAFICAINQGFVPFTVASCTGTSVELDRNVTLEPHYDYVVQLTRPTGETISRPIDNPHASALTTNLLTWGQDATDLPIVGSMWGLTISDLAPRLFRVVTVSEKATNVYEVTGLSYDPTKYDRIETPSIIPTPVPVTNLTQIKPLPASNIVATRNPVKQTDGTFVDKVFVTWQASPSAGVTRYLVSYQYGTNSWVQLPDATSPSTVFTSVGPGDYTFKVIAVAYTSEQSTAATATWTLTNTRPFSGARIIDLWLQGESPGTPPASFTGSDCKITWNVQAPSDWVDPSVTNWVDPYLINYRVRLYDHTGVTVIGTWTTTDESFIITREMNAEVNGGTPLRDFQVGVAMTDPYGTYGETLVEFTNPAPSAPSSVTLAQTTRGFTVSVPAPTDLDVVGGVVWVSTTNGFDPLVISPVYSGSNTQYTYGGGVTGTTYYVRVAYYDDYSTAPADLNISTQYSITLTTLGASDIDPAALVSSISATATAALTAGQLVNVYNSSGIACRPADASVVGKEANGFVLASVSMGGTATVLLSGQVTGLTGLTPGAQFLSAATPGASTATAPTGSGNVVQLVGTALTSSILLFEYSEPVVRT